MISLLRKQTARQASILLVTASITAKLLGFVRASVTARAFGIAPDYDLFLVVFALPTIVNATLSYTIPNAVTPFYQKLRVDLGESRARVYAWWFGITLLVLFVTLALGIGVVATPIVSLLAPISTPAEKVLATQLLQILAWWLPLSFGTIAVQTFLRAEGYYLACAAGPVLLDLAIVTFILLGSSWGVLSLAWGWVGGAGVHFLWLFSAYLWSRPRSETRGRVTPSVAASWICRMLIASFQVAAIEIWAQLFVAIDRLIAQYSEMPTGRIAALSYAGTLYNIPLAVFALSIAQATFPFLSAHVAADQEDAQQTLLSKGFRSALLVTMPMLAVLLVLPDLVIAVVYQRGAFDATATTLTADALRLYALGLPFYSVYAILASYLYAKRGLRNLTSSAIAGFGFKAGLGAILAWKWGYLGLAISTSVAGMVKTLALLLLLRKSRVRIGHSAEMLTLVWKSTVAVLPSIPLILWLRGLISNRLLELIGNQGLANLVLLFVLSTLLIGAYVFMVALLRVPEWINLKRKVVRDLSAVLARTQSG